jgi:chloramphenicol-sensitive protein RarD
MTRPLWYALAAYLMWGLFPLYWGLIRHVPTAQAMGHRVVWSAVVLGALVAGSRRRRTLGGVTRRVTGIYAVAAVLIGVNWTIYVWAVNAGFVVQTSLGYFITPLISVLLGVVVLRERLRRLQWIAVALATAGVLHLTRTYGALPWIALGLAISFGTYGLIKKRAPLPPVEGLLLETVILTPIALVYLVAIQRGGSGRFLHAGLSTDLLLVGTGLLTVVPLLLFATAVQRAPLSIVGILQYVSPTMQFLLGIFFFHEQFSAAQFTGFTLVWAAVLLFGADGLLARRSPRAGEPVT